MGTAICITGMHRSGTSLTASWLEGCGLPIHAGRLVAPAEGNPKGHYEDLDMVVLHDGALKRRGMGSVGWGVRGDHCLTFDPEERARAELLAAERDRRFPVWGWKDPRSALFLEQWKAIRPELKVLAVWRPAGEVVDSLVRRSRRTKNPDMRARAWPSIGLWKAHNQLVLAYKRRHPSTTVLLSLHGLLMADEAALHLIKSRFGVELPYSPIKALYDASLLNGAPGSARLALLRAATARRGCSLVEAELRTLSDDPGNDAG